MPDKHTSPGQEPRRPEPGWRRFKRIVGDAWRATMAVMRKVVQRREEDTRQALQLKTRSEVVSSTNRIEAERDRTGEAGVDSRPTVGIRCPVADRPAIAAAPSVPTIGLRAADTNAGAFRVLVAEDTEMNRQLVRALLARMGCEVVLAENGQQALEAIETGHFDLVLMDCLMPVMDGYEATTRLRLREAQTGAKPVPVIALTGIASEGDRARCIESGMDGYLAKPFTADTFMETIGRWMQPGRMV